MQGDLDEFASKFPDRFKVYYVLSQVRVHIDFHVTTIYCYEHWLSLYSSNFFGSLLKHGPVVVVMYPKKWFKITAHLLPLTSRSFFIIFNYLYFLYIFIYSKMWFPGWKQFSNSATTIKYSSNYRYWGAGHRAWTRPWQLILMHLDIYPPCNMSSNLSWRLPEYVYFI